MLRVQVVRHELVFSPRSQLAHCIDVLAMKPLTTSRQLSTERGTSAGPNGHWLSRLPTELKSPRNTDKVVTALRAAYAACVNADATAFKLPPALAKCTSARPCG